MHEIITLQLGQRANYFATHFWNTQESYFTYNSDQESPVDHDIHFRPGLGADGTETFTPRTVIYDLKGGFGSLRRINALYEIEDGNAPQALWNGPTIVQRQTAIQQHAYQQSLETGEAPPPLTTESVRYWSDFNRVYFHPRSIVQLNDYELNSSLMPFENWDVGGELFGNLDKEHDLLDRDLRPFAEEADHMQGIHIMASTDDAWGGFAAQYLDRIRDEYGKMTVWVWGLEDNLHRLPHDKKMLKLASASRSLCAIAPQASLYLPICLPSAALPPCIALDRSSRWHTSALLSAAMESMTLPARLRPRDGLRETLDELVAALNVNGNQNIARLQMSILQDEDEDRDRDNSGQINGVNGHTDSTELGNGSRTLPNGSHDQRIPSHLGREMAMSGDDEEDTPLDLDLFPTTESLGNIHPRTRTLKTTHTFGKVSSSRSSMLHNPLNLNDSDGGDRARRRAAGLTVSHRTFSSLSYSLLDSYPQIYFPEASPPVRAVGVRTSLATDTAVATRIKGLRAVVGRSVSLEEREALLNGLGELAEGYEEGWDSGSDEEND